MAFSKIFHDGKHQNLDGQINKLIEALEEYKIPSCASVALATDEVIGLTKQLKDLGAPIDDHDKIGYIINSLPKGYCKVVDYWMLNCGQCRSLEHLLSLVQAVEFVVDWNRKELGLISNPELAKNVQDKGKQQHHIKYSGGDKPSAGLCNSCQRSYSSAVTEPAKIGSESAGMSMNWRPSTPFEYSSDAEASSDAQVGSASRQMAAQVSSSSGSQQHSRFQARKVSGKSSSSGSTSKESVSFIFKRDVPCCITYDKALLYKYVKCESPRYIELAEKEFVKAHGRGVIYTEHGTFPAFYVPNETQNILTLKALDKKQPNLHKMSIAFDHKMKEMVRKGIKDETKLRFLTYRRKTDASSHMEKSHSMATYTEINR